MGAIPKHLLLMFVSAIHKLSCDLLCFHVDMRLFVALDVEEGIRNRIGHFIEQMRPMASEVRWVALTSLHITLKFIGEQPDGKVKEIESALATVPGETFSLAFRACGFFPSSKAARVFWAGLQAGPQLTTFAGHVEAVLETLGIEREKHGFNPHLTLARIAGGSGAPRRRRSDRPNRQFARIQQYLEHSAPPEFGEMLATEFFLYRSQLSSQGSRYSKLARFPLVKESA